MTLDMFSPGEGGGKPSPANGGGAGPPAPDPAVAEEAKEFIEDCRRLTHTDKAIMGMVERVLAFKDYPKKDHDLANEIKRLLEKGE